MEQNEDNIKDEADDNRLDLIDPSDGDDTDMNPFDPGFTPSDADEEVNKRPGFDHLDLELPDFNNI